MVLQVDYSACVVCIMGAHVGEGADIVFRCIGDDLAGLAAGVGELLTGRGWDGTSGKVLMTGWW